VASLLRAKPAETSTTSGGPFHVFLCSRHLSKGEDAAASLKVEYNNSLSVLELDVTSRDSIRAAVQNVYADVGRVDILVNNAGVMMMRGDPVCVLRETLETNLVSAYAMTEEFKLLIMTQLPHVRKDKRLIHITSDFGSITRRNNPADYLYHEQMAEYRISKAALNMMAACQRYATKDVGVKVCVYNPGLTATALGGQDPEHMKAQGARDAREIGDAFLRVVEGKRDHEFDKMLDAFDGIISTPSNVSYYPLVLDAHFNDNEASPR
jgi:NAD(P)-dependent dehydrogenase (short-subunit alcohol dehydrogenase family)